MEILDRQALGGDLPLQDHRGTHTEFAPHLRACISAARVESRDPFSNYVAQGHEGSQHPVKTVGDLIGGMHIQNDPDLRQTGAWTFALPVVTQEASKKPKKEKKGGPLKTQTRKTQSQINKEERRPVRVLPVRDDLWDPDKRFLELTPFVHPLTPSMPKGTPGIVLSGMLESKQHELLFPSLGNALVAVNAAGDPDLSTVVYDLTDEDELDELRNAQLHSFFEVDLIAGGGKVFGESDALVWQLGLSGKDKIPGRGLVVDSPGGRLTSPPKPSKTTTNAENTDGQHGAVTFVDDYMAQLKKRIQASQNKQSGGKEVHSQVRPKKTVSSMVKTQTPSNTPGPTQTKDALQVLAAMSARVSGPIEVGQSDDPHQLGQTKDGKPINCAHIHMDALYRGGRGDGPKEYDLANYEDTQGGAFMTPVHLRWDSGVSHKYVGGTAEGKWRWEAESPTYFPENPPRTTTLPGIVVPPPSVPPPSQPPPPKECQGVPGPGTSEGGSGADPISVGGTPQDGFSNYPGSMNDPFGERSATGQIFGDGGAGAGTGTGAGVGSGLPTSGGDGEGTPAGGDPTGFAEFGLDTGGPLNKGLTNPDGSALPGAQQSGGNSTSNPRDEQKDGAGFLELEVGLGIPIGSLHPGGSLINLDLLEKLKQEGILDGAGKPVDSIPRVGDGPKAVRDLLGGSESLYPTYPGGMRVGGGIMFRAFATAAGEYDISLGGFIRPKHLDKQIKAPDTAAMIGFGTGDGTWGSFTQNSVYAGRARTGPGGVTTLPSVLANPTQFADVLAGFYEPGASLDGTVAAVSQTYPGGLSHVDFAHPSLSSQLAQGTGGVRLRHTSVGLQAVVLNSVGVEQVSPRTTLGEGGFLQTGNGRFTGNLTVDAKLTVGGLIDPTGMSFTRQAADPGLGTDYTIWVRLSDSALMFSQAGTDNVVFPSSGAAASVVTLFSDIGAVGNVGAGIDVLKTFTLPANTLGADNDAVRIRAWGRHSGASDSATVALEFGSVSLAQFTETNAAQQTWHIDAIVAREGVADQEGSAVLVRTSATTPFSSTPMAQDETAGIVIRIIGQNNTDTDNDRAICHGMIVELIPAP